MRFSAAWKEVGLDRKGRAAGGGRPPQLLPSHLPAYTRAPWGPCWSHLYWADSLWKEKILGGSGASEEAVNMQQWPVSLEIIVFRF